jgi:acetyl/propionyl-CoA carboxylase alpha subunit
MRSVREPGALAEAVAAARREARSAVGDGPVYLERRLDRARHVEVQILADAGGPVVHLRERECSEPRRHQKILEESPASMLGEQRSADLCRAAVAAGEAIGYRNAGTVEFLVAPDDAFYFLEVNTRLQVEHPVTELVRGLDLVRLQIEIARGEELRPQAELPPARGHAIEARLYAEDPARGFAPSTGRLLRFEIAGQEGVRVDSGVESGCEVGPHYDPLLAKVIAWAPSRGAAAAKLAAVLSRARIHGLRTNRDLLVRILRHPEFLAGRADTDFLERHDAAALGAPRCDAAGDALHALAAALAAQAERRRDARVLAAVPSGFRNLPSEDQRVDFEAEGRRVEVAYRFARGGLRASLDGAPVEGIALHACTPELVDLAARGVRRRYLCARDGERHFVDSALGASELRELPRHPEPLPAEAAGSLAAPMPGLVTHVRVAVGDRVAAGEVLLVLEAMKMEQPVCAPAAGRVAELRAAEGEQVEAGRILAVIEPEAPDA